MTQPHLYTNVVRLPTPATRLAPQVHTVRLLHLDGRPFASAGFLPGLASAPWAWIRETVARECDVDEDQVGTMETDDGDMVTVDGLPVYLVGL